MNAAATSAESVTRSPFLRWNLAGLLGSVSRALQALSRRPPRRLRLCETLSLGEKRFVAVIEFDGLRFLVGATPASMVLLERLDKPGAASKGTGQQVSIEEFR